MIVRSVVRALFKRRDAQRECADGPLSNDQGADEVFQGIHALLQTCDCGANIGPLKCKHRRAVHASDLDGAVRQSEQGLEVFREEFEKSSVPLRELAESVKTSAAAALAAAQGLDERVLPGRDLVSNASEVHVEAPPSSVAPSSLIDTAASPTVSAVGAPEGTAHHRQSPVVAARCTSAGAPYGPKGGA